jgi:hypothetical protein
MSNDFSPGFDEVTGGLTTVTGGGNFCAGGGFEGGALCACAGGPALGIVVAAFPVLGGTSFRASAYVGASYQVPSIRNRPMILLGW